MKQITSKPPSSKSSRAASGSKSASAGSKRQENTRPATLSPASIIRAVWRSSGQTGHCYCRRVTGTYRDVWIVHHGQAGSGLYPSWNLYFPDPDPVQVKIETILDRFRKALDRAGFESKWFLFEIGVDWADRRRFGRFPLVHDPLARMERMAVVGGDRIPEKEWKKYGAQGERQTHGVGDARRDCEESGEQEWDPVCGTGDRIEMWERVVERMGEVYRVRTTSWSSVSFGADSSDSIEYIGARWGTMLYAGY